MNTREKGIQGESIACIFLENKGFRIVTRNYRKKWGEIDIIAHKDGMLHFVEVKSVASVSEQGSPLLHRPEENVSPLKVQRLKRAMGSYFAEQGRAMDSEFHFHVLCVFMDLETRRARVKWIQNVVL